MESIEDKTIEVTKNQPNLEVKVLSNNDGNIFYYNAKNNTLTPQYTITANYYKVNVSFANFPAGLWGQYNTLTNSITISSNIPTDRSTFTKLHEIYHSTGGKNENDADSYAAAMSGKWYFHRQFGPEPLPH